MKFQDNNEEDMQIDIAPLIDARDAAGVLVCEAFMVIYHPQWIKVRELIGNRSHGDQS